MPKGEQIPAANTFTWLVAMIARTADPTPRDLPPSSGVFVKSTLNWCSESTHESRPFSSAHDLVRRLGSDSLCSPESCRRAVMSCAAAPTSADALTASFFAQYI